MTTTPFIQIDFLNRKQLQQIARNNGILHNNLTTSAGLVTAIKAK